MHTTPWVFVCDNVTRELSLTVTVLMKCQEAKQTAYLGFNIVPVTATNKYTLDFDII